MWSLDLWKASDYAVWRLFVKDQGTWSLALRMAGGCDARKVLRCARKIRKHRERVSHQAG